MPYSAENPPEAIAKLPAAAQRIWIATYNSANEKYPGNEVRCNKIAWGAVKNAGYYQDEGGAWHKKEAEEAVTQRVCACPECGTEAEQQAGVPCTEIECPKCSTPMIGRVKEAWDTAYVNKLSDECFLHIEDGGEKDSEGKTVPRSLRHLPYKNEADQVDLPRLRNALSRLGQAATGEDWLSESLRKQLVAKAEALLEKHREKEVNTEPEPARPDDWASPKAEVQQKDSGGVLGWLRQRFDGLLGDLKGIEQLKQDTEPLPVQVGFKTFRAKDGKPWLLTWTTNSFRDREGEIFETKAIEDFVERHAADERKGEFWFWHLPGAKFGEIKWQATVGRFLVESGPFDNTPIGQKFYEFFSQHPQEHPALAPEGWGTSHGYYYGPQDLRDGVYSWFEKFETTVLPKSKASNQHSPGMEVLAMNAEQRKALEVVGGTELAEQIEQLGADRTKELEERGIAFKEAETPQPVVDAPVKTETKDVPAEVEGGETATEAEPVAEPVVDSKAKGVQELAQQIVAGLNLGGLAQAIKGLQESVQSMDTRLKSLEDIGQDEGLSPLIPMPQSAFWRATQMAQTETKETVVKAAAPTLPDAIAQMAKLVPIA